jgi:hypothetical protein
MDRKLNIPVSEVLQEAGNFIEESICIEVDSYEDLKFLKPIIGQIKFVSTNNDIIGYFKIEGEIEQICSRCGNTFPLKNLLSFNQVFTFDNSEENLQINKNKTINIFPVVIQEIILAIPIKPLCKKCKE